MTDYTPSLGVQLFLLAVLLGVGLLYGPLLIQAGILALEEWRALWRRLHGR